MVEIEKDYAFEGPTGRVRLLDLFEGRSQLIVYHFMFEPSWDDGCPSCTAGTDELSAGFFEHLHTRDTWRRLGCVATRCAQVRHGVVDKPLSDRSIAPKEPS